MGIFKILLIIIGIIVILIAGTGIYLYNFHVFKTIKFCVTNNVSDSNISCSSNEECTEKVREEAAEVKKAMEEAPDFAKDKLNEIFNEAVYCEQTCRIKNVRGFSEQGSIAKCEEGEKEILWEIHGKEGIKMFLWIKNSDAVGK